MIHQNRIGEPCREAGALFPEHRLGEVPSGGQASKPVAVSGEFQETARDSLKSTQAKSLRNRMRL